MDEENLLKLAMTFPSVAHVSNPECNEQGTMSVVLNCTPCCVQVHLCCVVELNQLNFLVVL